MNEVEVAPSVQELGTLFDLETNLQALQDTQEMVPEGELDAFKEAVDIAIRKSGVKRNRFYQFIRSLILSQKNCDAQIKVQREEIERLTKVKAAHKAIEDQMRAIVKFVMVSIGPNADGRYPSLKCDFGTFILPVPDKAKLNYTDRLAVPDKYKYRSVNVSLGAWEKFKAEHPAEAALLKATENDELNIDDVEVARDLEAGETIAGAELKYPESVLQIR